MIFLCQQLTDNRSERPGARKTHPAWFQAVDVYPHSLLNPDGVEISVPRWVFPRLRSMGLLTWNREKKRHQISALYYSLGDLFTCPDFAPHGKMGASTYDPDLGKRRGKISSRGNRLFTLLGPDCSGVEAAVCHCRQCQRLEEDLDDTASPHGQGREAA